MAEWQGQTALVTGASYGIGTAFAHKLAADGAHLILTARSRDRLEALADELRRQYGIHVTSIEADLAQHEAPQLIFDEVQRQGLRVDVLINNAGFGAAGDFAKLSLDRQLEMIQVNVTALVALAHLFVQPMLQRRAGAILNVSSTAAFQGVPYFAVYSATKSFILIFSEALWAECRDQGVRVSALCPGATESNFQAVAGTSKRKLRGKVQTAEEVVAEALDALAEGRSHVVTGWNNKLMVQLERLASRKTAVSAAERLFKQFAIRD
ncbi:MAG: SDR family oxidoreductase [Acidobacteria bacterium]|nr:SDR family oxidoreductase [Acidobacteriota bacterium]MBI3422942.1 SDR family oxidoreductase [Acidobacteriota bacterium]